MAALQALRSRSLSVAIWFDYESNEIREVGQLARFYTGTAQLSRINRYASQVRSTEVYVFERSIWKASSLEVTISKRNVDKLDALEVGFAKIAFLPAATPELRAVKGCQIKLAAGEYDIQAIGVN